MILGGDLGGTKTLLALAEPAPGGPRIVRQQRYASLDFASFDDLLADFLADSPLLAAACLGVAGPGDGRRARLTYLPWQIDAAALERRFGIGRVMLVNDFAAAAQGLDRLTASDLVTLRSVRPFAGAPRVVLGAGTGLGVAGLISTNGTYRAIPGEGGHIGFSPQTPEQGELWRWLLERNGRVTTEDIVSGPGLVRIHAFVSQRSENTGATSPLPEEIGRAALAGTDPSAVTALRLWLACFGAFAGDLALHWLADGGVYIAGGIAAKLLPHTDPAPFVDAFLAKREHRDLVAAMPIHLVTSENLGLLGALAVASNPVAAFPD